jgi:Phosphotransferase enzyme family
MTHKTQDHAHEQYRLLLLPAQPNHLLALWDGLSWRLPEIFVSGRGRPAEQLQHAIHDRFGLDVTVLDLPDTVSSGRRCAVAEVRSPQELEALTAMPFEQLADGEVGDTEKERLRAILAGERGLLSRPGWIAETITWVESEISGATVRADGIRQYNACGGFALLRLALSDGRYCWLKAAGAPNLHEFDVTCLLAEIHPGAIPPIVAARRDWNAWLMGDAGRPLESPAPLPVLEAATSTFASLQKACLNKRGELLKAGAFDAGLEGLRNRIPELIEYLSVAMEHQESTRACRLSTDRLQEIGQLLKNACDALIDLSIPASLVHNDLNPSNILYDGHRCVITDWAEAGVGNPFLAFEHLSRLASFDAERQALRDVYRYCWSDTLTKWQIDRAFRLATLVAVASYLYGRGEWLTSPTRSNPILERCARTLARHMDRAAHAGEVREVLCA